MKFEEKFVESWSTTSGISSTQSLDEKYTQLETTAHFSTAVIIIPSLLMKK